MDPVLVAMLDDNPDDLDIMAVAASEVDDVGFRSVLFENNNDDVAVLTVLRAGAADGCRLALLLDWHLPADAGLRVVAAVRADPEITHTHVLVNSGSDDPFDRSSALAAGADGYSVKPAGYEASVELIRLLGRNAR